MLFLVGNVLGEKEPDTEGKLFYNIFGCRKLNILFCVWSTQWKKQMVCIFTGTRNASDLIAETRAIPLAFIIDFAPSM